MIDHNDFHDNLSRIQVGEIQVSTILDNSFFDLSMCEETNDDNRYDIKGIIGDREVTFEIKEDIRCADTGNVVVEFESRGKPSGICTTKADFWVFRVHEGYRECDIHHYMIGTNRLKRIINEHKYDRIYKMMHTDSKNKVYFFKYDYLKTVSYQID